MRRFLNGRRPRRTSRGGQQKYSDLAISMCLTLRIVFGLPLRQTQGLMRTIAALAGVEMTVPDFSTPSRRGKGLTLPPARRTASRTPVHSTGLKVFGDGEWLENKHKIKTKRTSARQVGRFYQVEQLDNCTSPVRRERFRMKIPPHDIFRLSCLTWTRPESCSRLPISLKLCDTARAEF